MTALWYNGSTTGFGSVSEGSTPSGAAKCLMVDSAMRLSTTCEELAAYQISVLEVSVRVRLEHALNGVCGREA